MPTPVSQPKPLGSAAALLYHDGELADVRSLLAELGAAFVERRGALLPEDQGAEFGVVIATPRRMLAGRFDAGRGGPTKIAICDSDTRGLRNSLRRAGIQLMVRRPVHPAVLRALVLHALYRGPEKRRHVRVGVGAPVRFRRGLRQRPAILADISLGGCRLLTPYPVEPGRSIRLLLPPEVTGGKPFKLKGRIARHSEDAEGHVLTARFESLRPRQLERLKEVIQTHASGPATFEPATAAGLADPPAAAPARQAPASTPPRPAPARAPVAAPSPARVAPTPAIAPAHAAPADTSGDRRNAPRHAMDRRVIALGEAATRVLMGRDISLGGMRVNPNPLLVVGQDVRLAIHVRDQDLPLVVTAKVHRDDGERGIVLRFHRLEPASSRLLDRMLETLPVTEPDGDDPDACLIVSEILAEAH